MAIPASASIGILASGYLEDDCIGMLLARCVRMQDLFKYRDASSVLARRMLRPGVSVGVPTRIYGGYKTCTWT